MKTYTTYKIAKINNINNEKFTFGMLGNNTGLSKDLVKKINNGIMSFGLPYIRLIPYYKDSIFTFQNKDIVAKFLNEYCKLTAEDFKELKDADYCVWEIKTTSIVTGLSKLQSSVWLDESTEPNSIIDITKFDGMRWDDKKCSEVLINNESAIEYCRSGYGKLKTV